MNRRDLFKGALGSLIATVAAPVVLKLPKPIQNKLPNFVFPRINRVFPEFIAKELVSVQPMSGPTGQVFHINLVQTKKPSKWERMKKYILA
jgi:hypothetical protein